ncbi:MAG TPA: hypothetical protein VIC55_03155 [Gemmatimonadaceae bacterium]
MRSAAEMAGDVGRGACLSGSVVGGSGTTPPAVALGAAGVCAANATGNASARAIRAKYDDMGEEMEEKKVLRRGAPRVRDA